MPGRLTSSNIARSSSRIYKVRLHSYDWFGTCERGSGTSIRIFCLPYACGGASIYKGWQRLVDAGVEICAARLPGREMRISEPLIDELECMVDSLAEAAAPLCEVSYALFGHSMGALLAYELAYRLCDLGGSAPCNLIVSGSPAPQVRRDPLSRPVEELTDSELLEEIASGIHPGIRRITEDPELTALFMPIVRADFRICERYAAVPRAPLALPITVLHGGMDASVAHKDAMLWSACTSGEFEMHIVPGDHFFIHDANRIVPLVLKAVDSARLKGSRGVGTAFATTQ